MKVVRLFKMGLLVAGLTLIPASFSLDRGVTISFNSVQCYEGGCAPCPLDECPKIGGGPPLENMCEIDDEECTFQTGCLPG